MADDDAEPVDMTGWTDAAREELTQEQVDDLLTSD